MIAAPVAGRRGLSRLKRVFALCIAWEMVLSLGRSQGAGYDAGQCFWQTFPHLFSDR